MATGMEITLTRERILCDMLLERTSQVLELNQKLEQKEQQLQESLAAQTALRTQIDEIVLKN